MEQEYTEVISAFGGMALYRKKCFHESNYNQDVIDCEHVPFHTKLHNLNKKMVINKNFIKNYTEQGN